MRLLLSILLLQLVLSVQAFYRLGTVSVGGTSGTIYLIDSNTLFLASFSTSESVVFRGGSGASEVTATTSASLSGANIMLDGSSNWLNVSPIEVRTVSGDTLIASFDVPGNIQIPCSAEYLGRFTRPGGNTQHALAGHVFFDASNRRIFVARLTLDSNAPAAYMWLTTSTTPLASGKRAGYNGGYGRVDGVNNIDVNVTYPRGDVNTPFRSLSVWCEDFFTSFGHVEIPVVSDSFACSTSYGPVMLGNSPASHGVSANVNVLGPNTIGLKNLNFDGNAPATWFWVGTTSTLSNGFIVPDHTGSLAKLGALNNANIFITLPTDYDVCNTNFISLYCVQAGISFGELYFGTSFGCSNCPAICKTVITQASVPTFQCQDLSSTDQMEYRYDQTNSLVTFKFHTCDLEANQYFAFGLSASSSGVSMAPNGDVVVCQYSTTGEVDCSDYDLTIRSQCALFNGNSNGACPDTVFAGGVNNYINTQVETVNGLTTFTTTRAVTTTDSHDKPFTPGTPQYIIWARGGTFTSYTNERWVLRHAPNDRISAAAPIQIDYASDSTCSQPLQCPTTTPAPATPWYIPPLCIDSQNSEIQAAIGNTGGRQGYEAITGRSGWGIAWYLNGLLIPEVYVLRGTTVTFFVNGGEDPADSASYHPFYITNSYQGGINVLAQANQSITETVIAGLDYNSVTDTISNLTVGPYCEWIETAGNGDNFNTFEEYQATLQYSCSDNVTSGSFEWTPDSGTEDLLYFQCATHRLLGWKIRVVDSLDDCRQTSPATTVPTTPTVPTTTVPTGTQAPWLIPPVCIDSVENTIEAVIGDSREGLDVWYLNGIPAPEVYVKRGTEVKFYVNGGNDPSDLDNYHPLYLTSSAEGGILKLMNEGKPLNQTVYAGLQVEDGRVVSIIGGSMCRYEATESGNQFQSFQEFQDSLDYVCIGSVEAGMFSWITDANTPDTLYYQCAQHENNGMKIYVVDDLLECYVLVALAGSGASSLLPFFFMMLLASFLTLFFAL